MYVADLSYKKPYPVSIFMKQVAQFQILAQKLALLYFFETLQIIILRLLILFHNQEDLLETTNYAPCLYYGFGRS